MKKSTIFVFICAMLSGGVHNEVLAAEKFTAALWPNAGSTSIMTPTGWGASYGILYFGGGTTTPQVYSVHTDADAGAGFGLGNPEKNLGLELSVDMMDVSKQDNFSYGFKVHRIIANGTSIGFGGLNLFPEKKKSDADESFYFAISHAVQGLPSDYNKNESKLHLNLGVGNGMFSKMSPEDIKAGNGRHGTYVFGSTAYEIFKATNAIVEWSGMNLNAGISTGLFSLSQNVPVTLTIAAADLTKYTADGVRLSVGLSGAILF
ncbi:MAG: hypothetical protein HGA72_09700 [Chlorobiaceae bacterium]|nr:hypothetical protein [Chlorobiaceae bacterium]